jgi:hypothetical protein
MGLVVGVGSRYGLHIHSNMMTGKSYPCEIFGNEESLTEKPEFELDILEIYGIDSAVSMKIQ